MSERTLFPEQVGEARSRAELPYAKAWDKFTKLQENLGTDIRLIASFAFGGGAVSFLILHLLTPKQYQEYDILAPLAVVIAGFVYLYVISFEWLFWRCPRCQHKWPGWSNKDKCCEYCGLRLFQDAP